MMYRQTLELSLLRDLSSSNEVVYGVSGSCYSILNDKDNSGL